jgi:hypothetical protein
MLSITFRPPYATAGGAVDGPASKVTQAVPMTLCTSRRRDDGAGGKGRAASDVRRGLRSVRTDEMGPSRTARSYALSQLDRQRQPPEKAAERPFSQEKIPMTVDTPFSYTDVARRSDVCSLPVHILNYALVPSHVPGSVMALTWCLQGACTLHILFKN